MESFKDVIGRDELTLVDYFATWCQPCKTMHPVLEKVKEKYGSKIRVLKIDIDKNMDAASQFMVQSVPTLMLFRQGNVIWRQSGAMALDELQAIIDPHLK